MKAIVQDVKLKHCPACKIKIGWFKPSDLILNGIKLNMVNETEDKENFDKLSKEHQVTGFPACMIFVNGKKVADISGYRPPEAMVEEVKKHL